MLECREYLVAVAADDRRHTGADGCRRLGHGPATLTDEHHGLLGGDDACSGGGGDLTDAVAGDGADAAERVGRVGEERESRQQARRHEQRLGDGGVADRLGVGLRAVVSEVDTADGRQPVQPVGEVGVLEPRGEEARSLCSLAGGDDDKHRANHAG